MANPTVTVEIKSIGSEKVIKTLGKVRVAAKGVTTGVNKLGKATKKAADRTSKFKTKMTELGKSASLALGPLNGVAARLTAFSGLASMASFRVAGFIGGLVGAGGLVVAAVKVANSLDEMRKAAERTGLTFERFQEFQFVASQAGIGADKFSKAMDTFAKRLGEAKRGSGAAQEALKVLLGSLHEIEGIDIEEALLRAADGFQGLEGTMAGAAISANLFSKANQNMTKFLNLGRKGINETAAQARRLGFVFKNDVAVNATKAVDALDAMGKILKVNLARTIIGLLPLITKVALAFASWGPVIKDNIRLITTVLFGAIGALIGLLAGLPGAIIGGGLGLAFGFFIGSIKTLEAELAKLEARKKQLEAIPAGKGALGGLVRETALEGLEEKIRATKLAIADQEVFIKSLRDTIDLLSSLENKGAMKAFKALKADVKSTSVELETLVNSGNRTTIAYDKAAVAAAKFIDQFDLATLTKLAADNDLTLRGLRSTINNLFVEMDRKTALIRTFNETRTATEKFDLAMSELRFTFRGFPEDSNLLVRAMSKIKRAQVDSSETSQLLVRSFQSAGDGMVDAMTTAGDAMEVLRDTARSIVDDILKAFIRLAVVNKILNAIFGLSGASAFPTLLAGGGGVSAESVGGGGPSFAHGGSFRVGGSGGPDSQLVSFRATPGETFTATPVGKTGPGGGITINMNISTGVAATVRSEVLKLAPVIKSLVRRDIAEASRQGGRFNRAINS